MAGEFEQEVNVALQIFIAAVTRAAERTAVETIRAACARASLAQLRAIRAARAPSDPGLAEVKPVKPVTRVTRYASVRPEDAATCDRVLAYIGENPGRSPTGICAALGIYHHTLQRHLSKLVEDGTIRIEERLVGFGRLRHRKCFPMEKVNLAEAEHPAAPAEAMV